MRVILRRQWLLLVLLPAAIGFTLLSPYLFAPQISGTSDAARTADGQRRHYQFTVRLMDVPPVDNPVLVPAADARIDDEMMVIGVVVRGEPRAYLCQALSLEPAAHIVRDKIQDTPIAVSYCDRTRCIRVLSGNDPDRPLPISVGGWRADQTMELIIDGKRYSQSFPTLPLADVPFSEAPWGQWRKMHPDTVVYLGDYRNT